MLKSQGGGLKWGTFYKLQGVDYYKILKLSSSFGKLNNLYVSLK